MHGLLVSRLVVKGKCRSARLWGNSLWQGCLEEECVLELVLVSRSAYN